MPGGGQSVKTSAEGRPPPVMGARRDSKRSEAKLSMIYLESTSTDPAYNLALEQFVFDEMPREHEYFILWQNDNTIVVGKYQNTAAEVNAAYVKEHGIHVVRRLSGGGAVYHDLGNINFTFITDAENGESIDLSVFCQPVVKTLAHLGVKAEITGRNDITIDGMKFSGNAQYVKQGRIMHHGTIMFDSDLSVVAQALNVPKDKIESKGIKSVRSRVTNVKPYLKQDVDIRQFWDTLKTYMVDERSLPRHVLTPEEEARVQAIKAQRYDTWEWNYGRSPHYSIQKARRVEGCGRLELSYEVDKGVITAMAVYGDFFSAQDPQGLTQRLVGCRAEESALKAALEGVPVDAYFKNLTAGELVDIILQ